MAIEGERNAATLGPPIGRGKVTMRPKPVVYFERIIFGAILLGALTGYLDWDRITAQTPAVPDSTLVISVIFGLGLTGMLTLLVSHRRRRGLCAGRLRRGVYRYPRYIWPLSRPLWRRACRVLLAHR
jgi:hypothetical protein